jgi:hypothetical protein
MNRPRLGCCGSFVSSSAGVMNVLAVLLSVDLSVVVVVVVVVCTTQTQSFNFAVLLVSA